MGLQFENLILNHIHAILPKIGLSETLIVSAAPYVQSATRRGEGCQIDLLIQTRRSVCVVEIKRKKAMGEEVIDAVAEKVKRLRLPQGLSVRTALVYDGAISPAVREEGFFDFIVPASELFQS